SPCAEQRARLVSSRTCFLRSVRGRPSRFSIRIFCRATDPSDEPPPAALAPATRRIRVVVVPLRAAALRAGRRRLLERALVPEGRRAGRRAGQRAGWGEGRISPSCALAAPPAEQDDLFSGTALRVYRLSR